MADLKRIELSALEAVVTQAFVASNTAPQTAACVARALVRAEVDGRKGHGLSRVASYTAQARSGKVDGHASPTWRQTKPACAIIDVASGFAYPAFDVAEKNAPPLAAQNGLASVAFARSHHFGVAAHQVERFADAGFVALVFGNTPGAIAPHGGTRPVFGTNPVAFAAPRRNAPSIVIDLALSTVARGNILKASQTGDEIPLGWATDAQGQPTTDPNAALKGTLSPIGGAKGAALALMVEVLAVALTGANFAFEATSFFDADGEPPHVGQWLLLIAPDAFAGANIFAQRIETLVTAIADQEGTRLPGARVHALREAAQADGIMVDAVLLERIETIATSNG
ncbi:MAG: Ldh family oxidoreductase [Pseudomonadota bacterium]